MILKMYVPKVCIAVGSWNTILKTETFPGNLGYMAAAGPRIFLGVENALGGLLTFPLQGKVG